MAERKDPASLNERLSSLEGEVAKLRQEHADALKALDTANERVRELESARDQALDQIDWALDSLHNVLEQGQ